MAATNGAAAATTTTMTNDQRRVLSVFTDTCEGIYIHYCTYYIYYNILLRSFFLSRSEITHEEETDSLSRPTMVLERLLSPLIL